MTEKAYRFSAPAIVELNKHRSAQRLSARQFALLMAGLVASVVCADRLVNAYLTLDIVFGLTP